MHFTPTYSSGSTGWNGSSPSHRDLLNTPTTAAACKRWKDLRDWITAWNGNPNHSSGPKTAEEILRLPRTTIATELTARDTGSTTPAVTSGAGGLNPSPAPARHQPDRSSARNFQRQDGRRPGTAGAIPAPARAAATASPPVGRPPTHSLRRRCVPNATQDYRPTRFPQHRWSRSGKVSRRFTAGRRLNCSSTAPLPGGSGSNCSSLIRARAMPGAPGTQPT